ncbi:hypothetical protein [uncultured Williamsia sp.]|uniref:hypothetical protein n=1 Tax=uncultured Williamsia sp. TaxID=259311 RepID=UPI002627D969|nr:hypothetical protein [uncultured Williamsia sp.]
MGPDTYPDEWRPSAADGPIVVVVDGERFRVEMQADGGCRYTWVSGPNPGYGFSSGPVRVAWKSAGGRPPAPLPQPLPPIAHHRRSIRSFLAEIDPETGYLSD